MDMTQATEYDPLQEIHLPQQLAKIHTDTDAVQFVQRFGLLGTLHMPGLAMPNAPARDRQAIGTFQRAAKWIRDVMDVRLHLNRVVKHAQREANGHKDRRAESLRWLRNWARTAPHPYSFALIEHLRANEDAPPGRSFAIDFLEGPFPSDLEKFATAALDGTWTLQYQQEKAVWLDAPDPIFLRHVTEWIADATTSGLRGSLTVKADSDGNFQFALAGTTSLLDVCWFHIAHTFVFKEELRHCARPQCGIPFVVRDQRMKFCSSVCTDRSRKERKRAIEKAKRDQKRAANTKRDDRTKQVRKKLQKQQRQAHPVRRKRAR